MRTPILTHPCPRQDPDPATTERELARTEREIEERYARFRRENPDPTERRDGPSPEVRRLVTPKVITR